MILTYLSSQHKRKKAADTSSSSSSSSKPTKKLKEFKFWDYSVLTLPTYQPHNLTYHVHTTHELPLSKYKNWNLYHQTNIVYSFLWGSCRLNGGKESVNEWKETPVVSSYPDCSVLLLNGEPEQHVEQWRQEDQHFHHICRQTGGEVSAA